MESLKKQAAKLLGEQKKYRRWLAVFLCLAIVVTTGTVAALKMNGQALSHKQKVLECKLEVHEHTAECYETSQETGQKELICGFADYVVHMHNDDCKNAEGELVCQLPEVEAHVHEETCYEEQEILICQEEETPGHEHTEECRALICEKEETEIQSHEHTDACRTLVCGKEETLGHQHTEDCRTISQGELKCENTEEGHEHTAECYEQVETLICEQEETEAHIHEDSCYDFSACALDETAEGHIHEESCYDPYACGIVEGAEGHIHTEECFQKKQVVICGRLELHTHVTPEAAAAEGAESCYDGDGNLVCGIPELSEHVHGEDCFVTAELTKEEVEAIQGTEDTEQDAENVEESAIEQTLYQKTYEDEFIKIEAEYSGTANIPVEAELFAELTGQGEIAQEADKEEPETQTDDSGVSAENPESSEESGSEDGIEPVSEQMEIEPETDAEAAPAEENGAVADVTAADNEAALPASGENGEEAGKAQVKGRTELVAEEVTYRMGFRMNGVEIVPEDTVIFTVWNLEEEGTGPRTITYSVEDGFENMAVTLTRMVEVFVQTEFQKVYEDESIRVIAQYEDTAEIPEEAELRVRRITPESDPEHFAMREEEFKEQINDENAVMDILLNIGFFDGDKEIEPKGTVTITLQFLDGEGIAVGAPIDMVHFAEKGTEVLEASDLDETRATTFQTDSFSDFGASTTRSNGIPVYAFENGEWRFKGYIWDYGVEYIGRSEGYPVVSNYDIYGDNYGGLRVYGAAEIKILRESIAASGDKVVEEKWIAYSTSEGEEVTITTAQCIMFNDGYENAPGWKLGEQDAGKIKAIYYLPGNTKEYDNEPLPTYGETYTVIFNPGNVGNDTPKAAYGSIAPVTISIPKEAVDEDGYAEIRLPNDSNLGNMFAFHENGEDWPYVIGKEKGYNYKLVGWYNIIDQTYYDVESAGTGNKTIRIKVTEEAQTGNIDRKIEFYGDWIAESYTVPAEKKTAAGTGEDISDFVTTRVYDYNELFNVYSAQLLDADGWETQKNFLEDLNFAYGALKAENGHTLNLQQTNISNLPFIQSIPNTNNTALIYPGSWASFSHNSSKDTTQGIGMQGILSGKDSLLLKYLFPEINEQHSALGVHFVGYGDGLYKHYDTDSEHAGEKYIGYYQYDSNENAALYDKGDQKFYIQDATQGIHRDSTRPNIPSFLPFNYDGSTLNEDSAAINYHFGLCSEIEFYLPATPGTSSTDINGKSSFANSIDGQDMIFEFSGDDDVWVFVDDKLILDLGGMKAAVTGAINFSSGIVTDVHHPNGNSDKSALLQSIKGGENHKLTIYYLERGAGLSNCKIKFNIVPRYKLIPPTANTVTVKKVWFDQDDDAQNPEANDSTLHKGDSVTVCLRDKKGNEIANSEVVLDNSNNWSHTWEALPPKSDYVVVEKEVKTGYSPSYVFEPAYQYKYWAETDTLWDENAAEKEVVILNRDNDNTVALAAEGKSITTKKVTVTEGVIQSGADDNTIKWTVEQSSNGCYLKNEAGYLHIDAGGISISDSPQAFKLDPKAYIRLCTESYRIVYENGSFQSRAHNGNEGDNEHTVNISVRVFSYHDVDSIVKNYTITNTYLPAFTIKKVDSRTNEELTGAKFKLTRSYQRTVQGEIQDEKGNFVPVEKIVYWGGYYDSDGWHNFEAKSLEAAKEEAANKAVEFELSGNLRLEEMEDGEYVLTEISAPERYLLPEEADKKITFTVVEGKIQEDKIQCGTVAGRGEDGTESNLQIAVVEPGSNYLILLVRNEKQPEKTTRIRLLKYSKGAEDGTPLGGASFNLYKELTEDEIKEAEGKPEEYETIKPGETELRVRRITEAEGMRPESVSDVGQDKGLFFDGSLPCGSYYLEETKAPDGFNVIVGMVKMEIKDENGTLSVTTENNSQDIVSRPEPGSDKDGSKYFQIKIFNTEGYELPETGSLGTKPFTIGGAMLILATASLMYGYSVRRRKSERRSKK